MNQYAIDTDIPMVDLELVRGCTLRCRWCPVDKMRPLDFMDIEFYERLVREALRHRIGYRRFSIFLGGEPLLHPEFGAALEILRSTGYRDAGYRKIQIFTNGVALTPERAREILETDVLTRISISVDGIGDAPSFAYMRPPAKLAEVIANVAAFMERRATAGSRIEVVIISIIPRPHQVPFVVPPMADIQASFRRLFSPWDITLFEHRFLRDEYSNPEWRPPAQRDPLRPCFLAKDRKLVILHNGDVAFCAKKLGFEQVIGEVRTTDMISVWNLPEFYRIRQARISGDFGYRADLCRNCDCGPYVPSVGGPSQPVAATITKK